MLTMHPLLQSHREAQLAIARRRGATDVRVFGSVARGDLQIDAQELLGRHVDVVTEAGLHPALRARATP